MGRFLNTDVVYDYDAGLQGFNLFIYCGNNPVNRIDISGADSDGIADGEDMLDELLLQGGGAGGGNGGTSSGGGNISVSSTGGGFVKVLEEIFSWLDIFSQTMQDGTSVMLTGGIRTTPNFAACFVAGTLVQTEAGAIPIEDICIGDLVWAWDEETGDVALKEVVETYINETSELIHLFVNGEEIITTPSHPFYSPVKGWTDAVKLRAGDILVLVNGEYVVVEKVQREILEAPITVYNLQVEGYHTYYVAENGVLVHNSCAHNSAWSAERAAYWRSESFQYAKEDINGQVSQSGTYEVTPDNVYLMSRGFAPVGLDGKKVQLHHPYGIDADFDYYYEIQYTDHYGNYRELHSYLYE